MGLNLWAIASAVATELLIGLVMGYAVSLPLIGVQVGGKMVDQQMGLGLAGVFNPDFNVQTGIVSQFYFMMALAMFVILGGHRVMIATLVGSFSKVPLGGFRVDGNFLQLIVGLLTTVFELALRITGPILCLIFLQTVAMGFIARTVPQMNILSIGFALRIVVGVIILIGSLQIGAGVYAQEVQNALQQIKIFFVS